MCAAAVFTLAGDVHAQEDRATSMTSDAALEAHAAQVESRPYTLKQGDFRLLLTPQLGFDYNDNISASGTSKLDDFILRSALTATASYPIGKRNLLTVNLTVGYDNYLKNTEYSYLRLDSGSLVSFDVLVKEFLINVHDRFSYTHDPGTQSSVANAPRYGGFDNTAGISITRDYKDLIPTLSFDHNNYLSSESDYDYMNRRAEMFSARAGYVFLPTLTAGLEASGSFTRYETNYLNDSFGYSAGLYGDYRPSRYLSFLATGGYSAYLFDQTSRILPAVDQDAWYVSFAVTHAPIEAISYTLSAGHDLSLGQQADALEKWYARVSVNWFIIKHWTLGTVLSYENGSQGQGQGRAGGLNEDYDYLGAGVNLGHDITKRLRASLNYRFTFRSSGAAAREYTQNLVGLLLTYSLQ